jgi:branched-chain amino acid transport system substrate-binding protein
MAGSSQTSEYKAFVAAFQKKFGKEPTIWADFAYDAMMLVAKAIEKNGYTSDGIQRGLFEVSEKYVGASGAKKFDQFGISQGSYEWMVVRNGEWVLYEKK